MSQNTIKILRVSTVEVLREFSESDGKLETTPFFHASSTFKRGKPYFRRGVRT